MVFKDEFFDALLTPDGKVTKGKEERIGNVECVVLKLNEGTFYLDKKDGRPVRFDAIGDGQSSLDFSYGKVNKKVEAPTSDHVIDVADLGQ